MVIALGVVGLLDSFARFALQGVGDPFFGAKFVGHGMGLAVVKGIVRDHGGTIDMASVPGEGTTFRVLLPCSAKRTAEIYSTVPVRDPAMEKDRYRDDPGGSR
jgi:nitrogen fixation/metabolism regulation signal transduction histidine kinase